MDCLVNKQLIYTVWVKKITPWGFLAFFPNQLGIFLSISLHTYYTFLSTLDYKFLFNYLKLWRSYAILSATTQFTSYAQNVHHPTIGQNAHVQTFAKVVDSFVDRCLWQVITDLCSALLALWWSLVLTEVCEMLEASHPTHGSRVGWVRSGEFGGHWSFAQFVVFGYFTHS